MTRSRRTLLIIDDEALFVRAVADYLSDLEVEVLHAATLGAASAIARERLIDVVLLDQQLPDGSGADLCPALLEGNEQCKIIFVTAYPSFDNVVTALRGGAFDYVVKPCEPDALRLAVLRSLRMLDLERRLSAHERERERSAEGSVPYFGPGLESTRKLIEIAARVESPVLLTGETGTGKSMVARAIHFGGARKAGEFVAVNCAALPESLIEAELFGFERGTFTGAAGPREGLFEMADGGTILLDEITELPVHLQARLLHVLDDHSVRRLGSRSLRKVRFRLIAATNLDPAAAVASQRLREDLFHRLNVLQIPLPPLRDRLADLPVLTQRLLRGLGVGPDSPGLAAGEEERLVRYAWPGNVRELRNVLERALLVSDGGLLTPSASLGLPTTRAAGSGPSCRGLGKGGVASLAEVEQRYIAETLERCGGVVSQTARALDISRSTLRRKLKAPGA
ncbi:MAG: sigma-54 dependent transcriptional regulator [Thermoanaerobaculia bacterium]